MQTSLLSIQIDKYEKSRQKGNLYCHLLWSKIDNFIFLNRFIVSVHISLLLCTLYLALFVVSLSLSLPLSGRIFFTLCYYFIYTCESKFLMYILCDKGMKIGRKEQSFGFVSIKSSRAFFDKKVFFKKFEFELKKSFLFV